MGCLRGCRARLERQNLCALATCFVECERSCPCTGSAARIRQETLQVGLLAFLVRSAFPPVAVVALLDRTLVRVTAAGPLRIRTGFPVMTLRPPEGHRDLGGGYLKLRFSARKITQHDVFFLIVPQCDYLSNSGIFVSISRHVSALFKVYK
jgi:hypothetical protein